MLMGPVTRSEAAATVRVEADRGLDQRARRLKELLR